MIKLAKLIKVVAMIAPMVHTMTRKDKESVSHAKKANTTTTRVKPIKVVAVIAPMVNTMTRKDKEYVSHAKKANTTATRV